MKCRECEKEVKDSAVFCSDCGCKLSGPKEYNSPVNINYYASDWRQTNTLSVATLAYVDLLVKEDGLYIIQLPRYRSGVILASLVGLLIANFFGFLIGSTIAHSVNKGKRRELRKKWLNKNNQLATDSFKEYVLLHIPQSNLDASLKLRRRKVVIEYGGNKVVAKKNKKEVNNLQRAINGEKVPMPIRDEQQAQEIQEDEATKKKQAIIVLSIVVGLFAFLLGGILLVTLLI
ncbi:MAG: hypothetical protein WDZ82_00545 [Candidatus Paceibacterota bacterium]